MKKKIIKYAAVVLLFCLADLRIYLSLSYSYKNLTAEKNITDILLYSKISPFSGGQPTSADEWVSSSQDYLRSSSVLFLQYNEEEDVFTPTAAQSEGALSLDEGLMSFWNDKTENPDDSFEKALESVYYGEIFTDKKAKITSGDTMHKGVLYYTPVMDEEGFELQGMLLVFNRFSRDAHLTLLQTLLILAALVFIGVYGISTFARDVFTGYGVLILYAVTAVFIAFPLFEALRLTFFQDGHATGSVWKSVFSVNSMTALWGSLKLGFITASISTIIGFIFAYSVERTAIKGKKFITAMANMPIISPPFSLTLSIILLAGNNGLITKKLLGLTNFSIYGLAGLVIVQTISMFPIAFMTMQGILRSIDSTVEDASLDLSATRLQTFLRVTLPLAVPGILSSWLLVFTNSLADFANPLLLSGNYRVLSVEAYIVVTGRNNLGLGAGLSILLLLPTLTAFMVQRYWINRKSYVTVTGKPSTHLTDLTTPPVRTALTIFIYTVIVLITSLYLTIIAGCFVKNWGIDYSFTLVNIGEALSRGRQAIFDTLTLAGIATPIAGILSMAAALLIVRKKFAGKRILELLIMTPYAVPGTLIGISYILAFNKEPLILVGTAAIIIINYVIRELPVGVETGAAALRQIDPSIEESAADLGADSPTVFRTIVLPLIRPAFITSMSYTFVRSMTAVSAIIFLISARWYHLTVQIYNFSENLRFGLASVLATVLIIIILAVFGLLRVLVPDTGLTSKTIR